MGIFWEVLLIEIGLFCESLLWVSFDWNRPLFHICQRRRSGVFACCSRISKAPLRRCCAVSFVGLFYGSLVIEIDLFWGSLLIEIGLLDTFHVCQCRRSGVFACCLPHQYGNTASALCGFFSRSLLTEMDFFCGCRCTCYTYVSGKCEAGCREQHGSNAWDWNRSLLIEIGLFWWKYVLFVGLFWLT